MRKLLALIVLLLIPTVSPSAPRDRLVFLTGEIDAHQLKAHADSEMVPPKVVYGIAWMETRSGESGNKARGPGIVKLDSITVDSAGETHAYSHRICREVGRMQLNPCINWQRVLRDYRCSLKRLKASYDDNVYCGIKNMRRLNLMYGKWEYVPLHYNGAQIYQGGTEGYLGHIALKELN